MSRRIRVEITRREDVEISDEHEMLIAVGCIHRKFDIPEGVYIKNGDLIQYYGEEKIRKATDEDRKVIEFVAMLKQK